MEHYGDVCGDSRDTTSNNQLCRHLASNHCRQPVFETPTGSHPQTAVKIGDEFITDEKETHVLLQSVSLQTLYYYVLTTTDTCQLSPSLVPAFDRVTCARSSWHGLWPAHHYLSWTNVRARAHPWQHRRGCQMTGTRRPRLPDDRYQTAVAAR